MKIKLISVGKTDHDYFTAGIDDFEARIRHFVPYESRRITPVKFSSQTNPGITAGKDAEKVYTQHHERYRTSYLALQPLEQLRIRP